MVSGHGWQNGGAKSNQAPTVTRQSENTVQNDSINLLLEHGLADGLPRIAEMLLNAAMLGMSLRSLKLAAAG